MNVRQEKGLSGLWVGMWRASSQSTLLLFVLPMDQQFVFLVGSAPHRRSILSGIAQRPASPCPGQRVQAFEVGWQGLVGMQYSNPLCSPGRLVLEARGTRRRTFKSVRVLSDGHLGCLRGVLHTKEYELAVCLLNTQVALPQTPSVSSREFNSYKSTPDIHMADGIGSPVLWFHRIRRSAVVWRPQGARAVHSPGAGLSGHSAGLQWRAYTPSRHPHWATERPVPLQRRGR